MPIETIKFEGGKVKLIDQTLLPHRFKYLVCNDVKAIWHAIRELKVRGAPAIGIAAALGVVLGVKTSKAKTREAFIKKVKRVSGYLASSRPTAVNLFWALERMGRAAERASAEDVGTLKKVLLDEALELIDEDKRTCRRMAKFGARLIKAGDRVLTHCNAGGLATADYGTALGVLFEAKAQGKRIKVYVGETRPLLQGARLTTWELMREGLDTTLICDNMAASLMRKGRIDKVFVGADRIAANGDFANKIGTYGLAVLARHHRVPFYVVAPVSTIDFKCNGGDAIPIEERGADEVRKVFGVPIAPEDVNVYNPAFDVTPNEYVAAIITERGIFRRPYAKNLKKGGAPFS